MDTVHQNIIENTASSSENGSRKFFIAAIIEIIFFLLIIGIPFSLNYTNAIRLEQYFPFLSFLPHVKTENSTISPITGKPRDYNYDVKLPQTELPPYVRRVLLSQYVPFFFDIKENLSSSGRQEDTDYTFGSMWSAGNIPFHAFYHFNDKQNVHMDSQILFSLPMQQMATEDVLRGLLPKYFQSSNNPVLCKQDAQQKLLICEQFYTRADGTKTGIGDVALSNNYFLFFSCELPPKSDHYSWKSCAQQYANNGI